MSRLSQCECTALDCMTDVCLRTVLGDQFTGTNVCGKGGGLASGNKLLLDKSDQVTLWGHVYLIIGNSMQMLKKKFSPKVSHTNVNASISDVNIWWFKVTVNSKMKILG